ncbi:GNAT family N-acetyltransferase [Agaribacter flavus]|uniref:GNAT family N-acetyltransferase n=1 Tax=Agaribacter flavus TaxID=1902781 RepID=A0ABV7FTJ2_9ALTE
MLTLRQGELEQADLLVPLILASAPELLAYIFGSTKDAESFLKAAVAQHDGQFSARRHRVATMNHEVVACVSIWHADMPVEFHDGTLQSIARFLSPAQMTHVISINPLLVDLFPPPTASELCLGHLSVRPDFQGIGVASKLLSYVVRQARQMSKELLVLDVDENNEAALAFYEKWHFRQAKRTYFPPTEQFFLRLVLPLDSVG